MRAFIAIGLPQGIKDSLAGIQDELRSSGADVKWIRPENIHLTLKFLGDIDEIKKDKISNILERITAKRSDFRIRISSLGAFPKITSPRVIWVGIDEGDKESKDIAAELEEEAAKIGIPKEERDFSSHITIGRKRSPSNLDKLINCLKEKTGLGEKDMGFYAGKITLFKSTLTPKGPIYEALKEATLKNT